MPQRDVVLQSTPKSGKEGSDGTIRRLAYCCPHCPYWNRSLSTFHNHLLVEHRPEKAFKCSACVFQANDRDFVEDHIIYLRLDGRTHLEARSLPTLPIPSNRHASFLRSVFVPIGKNCGMLDGESAKRRDLSTSPITMADKEDGSIGLSGIYIELIFGYVLFLETLLLSFQDQRRYRLQL